MIKTQELRIGNILENGWEIIRMDIGSVIYHIETFKGGTRRIISSPFPELLTEEWLKKFGFRSLTSKTFISGVFVIQLYDDGGFVFGTKISDVISWLAEYRFVHQLQNLFWCLTGKELEVKEPIKETI